MARGRGNLGSRRMRDWYFDGYVPTEVTSASGRTRIKYEYHGKYYSFGLDKPGMRQMKLRFLWPTLLCLVIYVVGLLLPAQLALLTPGVIYLFFILPVVYYIIGFYGFLLLKPEFTTRELYSSVRRMEVSVWIMAILGAASLLVSLYFLFFQISYQSLWLELLFLFCGAASTALSLVLVRLQKQYEYAMVRDEGAGELDDEDDDPL